MTGQLALDVTGIDLARFAKFTPALPGQHRHWQVMGEPKPGAKGYARFNCRTGLMLGTLGLIRGGDYVIVLQFPDGEVESFAPMLLSPDRSVQPC